MSAVDWNAFPPMLDAYDLAVIYKRRVGGVRKGLQRRSLRTPLSLKEPAMHSAPIASDCSYEVLKLRRLRGELGPCVLDSQNRTLHRVSGFRAFIADVDEGDCLRPTLEAPRSSTLDLSLSPSVFKFEG